MLGRTANGLFWMFRYLERAENTARLLDAGLRMALTRDLVTAEEEWRSVMATAGQKQGYEAKHGTYTGMQAWNYMLRDKDNPASILSMFGQVRQNARLARNAISGELWEAINENWLVMEKQLGKPVGENRVLERWPPSPRRTLAHGAMEGPRCATKAIISPGRYVYRACRQHRAHPRYQILPAAAFAVLCRLELDTGQWDCVLRSVSGDHAYRWLNAGQIDAKGICEFLILDDAFPRSLAFCHSELRANLAALARLHGREGQSNELMREADTRIADLTIDEVFDQGLHEFLIEFMSSNAAIGQAIAQDYRFLA